MATETLTIRVPRGTKEALQQRAKPNVNRWLNRLIERELNRAEVEVDWEEHFTWLRKHGRVIRGNPEDELRRLNR